MRPVLALALALLGLSLALNHIEAFVPAGPPPRGADRALELLVGAKGPLLPPAAIGSGPERLGEAMRIGERTLTGDGRSGLRAVFVEPGFALRGERCYDVARSPADRAALVRAAEQARAGEILLLASSGRIEPEGTREGWNELEETLARLGARARPGTATPESWALIAFRAERRWVSLAEGYSRDSGVALAYVIGRDTQALAEARGELTLVQAAGPREVRLEDELQHASQRTPGVEWVRAASVLGRRMPALLFPPAQEGGVASPGRLAWSRVTIGAGAGLIVWLGIAEDAPVDEEGLEFEVCVDGERVAHRRVRSGTPWRPLQADLRPFAGRTVELELSVAAPSGRASGGLLLAHPTLAQGFERSPLEVWAGER